MLPLSFSKAYFKANFHQIMSSLTWLNVMKVLTLIARLSMNGSTMMIICVSFERFLGKKSFILISDEKIDDIK